MARPLRIQLPGLTYHVTGRGNGQMTIYVDDFDHHHFLETLEEVVDQHSVDCHSFCMMRNHYHLVVTTQKANISVAIKHLNEGYAQWWNRRHKHVGHLFQGRFGAKIVQDGIYLARACRYTVLNPVRAGVVDRPERFVWSSYRSTAGLAPAPSFLNCEVLYRILSADDRSAQTNAYRQFVAQPDHEATKMLKKAIFGDVEFVANFREWRDRASREVPRHERQDRPDLDLIFAGAATREQRQRAAAIARASRYSIAEIGRYLGVATDTARRMAARGEPR